MIDNFNYNKCEKCGRERQSISCPDDIQGCLVLHYAKCECEKENKLKTLKKIKKGSMSYLKDGKEEQIKWVDEIKLKQEAIKWIKFERQKFGNKTLDTQSWIKQFFNLTEEDLK